MKTKDRTELVAIGRVGSAAGLKGEFRVNLYAANSENLKEGKHLLFRLAENKAAKVDPGRAGEFEAVCRRVRFQKDTPVISVEGIDDRNAAEDIRGMEVCIEPSELDELPEGEHYVRNLIGCKVVDIAGGAAKEIGTLRDVIQNTAQSVLDVETAEGRTILIPAVKAFMRSIDEEGKLIEVELIPGFLE